jgi:hypothetical protein
MAEYERVSTTAKRYGVTSQTVYNWLLGIGGKIEGVQDPDTKAWKVVKGAKYYKPEVSDEMVKTIDECL